MWSSEIEIVGDMIDGLRQVKADGISAPAAWWKLVATNGNHLVVVPVIGVDDSVNAAGVSALARTLC